MKRERQAWQEKVKGLDPSRFIFLDEANAKTTMTRLYGRGPLGMRVVDHVPDGRWESTTMLAGLAWEGAGPCLTYQGGTDIPTMLTYVKRLLVPVLRPRHIVVMDNLSSHKHRKVAAAIESTGAQVWFLPRYSPDFNPIERMWSKVKAYLRKVAARTKEALFKAIGEALATITAEDARNWTRHAGYNVANNES